MPPRSLTDLPTEILESIFFNLDPHSLIAVSQTNKPIQNITADSPILWRHLCQTQFKTWDARHNIAAKLAGPLSDVQWRRLFIEKWVIGLQTRKMLNQTLHTQHRRIACLNLIADFGYDAKEALLRELNCPDDAEDVLARRYYARAVLERIHREVAIRTWMDLQNNKHVPLERALGAFDVFARAGEEADMDVIENAIDQLAQGVTERFPDFDSLSPRVKASTLATYLRDQGFRGVPDSSYRALSNSFIGLVLASATHQSLPLISVAIYCALARRVGLDARPCGFVHHVYTLVYAPPKHTLDGKYRPSSSSQLDYMYLDPFRSSDEVQQRDLERTLRNKGIPQAEHKHFLTHTTTRDMVLRTARNIMNSVQMIQQTEAGRPHTHASWLTHTPDMHHAFYATLWAMMLLSPGHDALGTLDANRRRQYLPFLLDQFQTQFPIDTALLETYILPLFPNSPERQRLLHVIHSMRQTDRLRKPVSPRTPRAANVRFRIGHLFRHKRYLYEGIVVGWSVSCDAGEEWIQNMRVDRLPRGRHQAFYEVVVGDKSIRYVAEENIERVPVGTEPSEAILRLAGRYFKRWDREARVFVSNVRDVFPDD